VGRSLVIASGASEIAAAEMPGLWPMTMRCRRAGRRRVSRQDVSRPRRDTGASSACSSRAATPRHLGEGLRGLARARGGAGENQIGTRPRSWKRRAISSASFCPCGSEGARSRERRHPVRRCACRTRVSRLGLVQCSHTNLDAAVVLTRLENPQGFVGGGESASPVRRQKRAPCRGQMISVSSMGASSKGESSWCSDLRMRTACH
jgi:hypothetical protein